ncbi:MBL fold metallo-hydrolase [Peptoniphilus catoniae]|uniref:MBL fold metallo-hydrolase n=1 Tax=Peptoniphilus catoniae TaxID=1660341 RepID=UPI001C572E2B|nr:MBL fold metallo-hydrolase [Peptoniphilus catoniae]
MDNITEVYKNIYRAVIPLRGNPLKSINIFIIKGEDKTLIVDTGFNTEEVRSCTDDYIEKLNIDLNKTIVFITHLHSDHTGLTGYFTEKGAKIYMPSLDAEIMDDMRKSNGKYWKRIQDFAHIQGLGVDGLRIEDHPGFRFRTRDSFDFVAKNPGDEISLGDFNFKVISLSGHTPGMVGLYDKDKSILFCGDHILYKITSNIQFWGFDFGDSLGNYLKNLKKVKELNIKYLYGSHRNRIRDANKRIDEIFLHHDKRLKEAYSALENGPLTPRDVTVRMKWDITAKTWEEFPKSQKWFAVGEAHAHLEHLRTLGKVDYIDKNKDGVLYYFIKK